MELKTRREIADWLRACAAGLRSEHPVEWDGDCVALADLGIDSLAAAELVCSLEDWLGVDVPSSFLDGLADTDALITAVEQLDARCAGAASVAAGAAFSDYERFVNPHLASKLYQLKIARTFVRAQGCWLYDAQGVAHLDFMAQYGALPFGHHPREIWQALEDLREDAEPIFAQPSLSASSGRLARHLIEIAPRGLRYVTFSNSGAESVEAALKMARHATGRAGILSTHGGFHGKTFGALSATGNPDYQVHFGLPIPEFDCIAYGDERVLEATLAGAPGRYAAFIVETIQGEGGVLVAPPGYLRAAKELCAHHGTLLIVDEVQTGLGRTGSMFSCDDEGVCPDILTLAKALGGGVVPIGATLCTEAVYSEKFALKHSSTFAGNALAARAGLASIALLTRDGGALLKNVTTQGAYLRERLEAIRARHPWLVEEVRGRGFMLGLRFTSDRRWWPENFLGIAAEQCELAQFVAAYLLNVERVRLAPTLNGGNVLRIQPPLNATHEHCVMAADALERTVKMIASRRTGDFYRAILRGQACEAATVAAPLLPEPTAARTDTVEASRFAFLLHPLDERGYADYDTSLASLELDELREFSSTMAGLLDPVVGSSVEIESATGARARGDFILISYTADQLKCMPQRQALQVLGKGLALARGRGAAIVGLGAYTSIVSGGGAQLANAETRLTSGNSYTVVSAIEALDEAVDLRDLAWEEATVAVVGAAGAIGSCLALLLAERAPRLVLVGNPMHKAEIGRDRLMAVARMLVEHVLATPTAHRAGSLARHVADLLDVGATAPGDIAEVIERDGSLILTSSLHAVSLANVVVTATSFPGSLFDHDVLRRRAIVCDISRPRSVGPEVVARRPDLLVIDGGVITLPNRPRVGPYGIEDGTSYACMAETMLLALEGDFRDTSLGPALDVREIKRQQLLARKHGFAPARLRVVGPIELAGESVA
jgi:acetylornithine/succinyldiaminopimelate/putrescine aminotransferase/predicted amino acid dehydrogenase/acyl carrier protein